MASKDLLFAWVRDAHGMEKALIGFTEKALRDFEDSSEVKGILLTFIDKSSNHKNTIESLLQEEASTTSSGKDFIGSALSFLAGTGSSMFVDDKTKNLLVLHGLFHFAHACYVSLSHGAKLCDEESIADMSSSIAKEKEGMAQLILEQIPSATEVALASKSN